MVDIAELALKVNALEIKQANSELAKLSKTSASTDKSVKDLSSSVSRSFAIMKTGAAALATAFGAIQSFRVLTDAAIQMDRFTNALVVGTGSAEAAAREMQFLREQSDELGLNLATTAEQYSKLSAAAAGTALEGQATREIFVGVAQASTALGLSAEQTGGALTAMEQIISKGKVSAEELRGQLGERLPGAFQIAARSIGVTTQELDKMLVSGSLLAEDLLPQFAEELQKTFGPQAQTAAEGLNAQLNRMETAFFDLKIAIGETGIIDFFNDAIQGATKFLNTLTGAISTTKKSAIAQQIDLIDELEGRVKELQGKGSFFGFLKSGLVDNTRELHATEQALEDAIADLERMREEAEAVGNAIIPLPKPLQQVAEETEEVGKSSKKASDGLDRFRKKVFDLTQQFDPLERMNNELRELVMLRDDFGLRDDIFDAAASQAINDYVDSLEKVTDETEEADEITQQLGKTGQRVFEDLSQFAIQGARNIQNALADALLDGINGFENFAKDVLDIIKRLAANIASVKILEGLGLQAAFGGGSASLPGSGGGLAGLGSSAFNLVNSGFGASSLFGQFATSGIGQSLGLSVTGPVPQFGQLTSMGSAIGTGLATAGAGAIGFGIGSSLAGDKRVFGQGGSVTSAIGTGLGTAIGAAFGMPAIGAALGGILGGGINALFGRGPLKQQDSLLRGTITEQGIGDDFLTATNFRAKGGVLRGDKVDRVIINANTGELVAGAPGLPESGISSKLLPFADEAAKQAVQVGQLFDQAISGFNESLTQSADALGISSDSLDNFQRWVQLTATSAEGITESQVVQEIQNIGDHMANVLLPGLQNMRKGSETAMQALARMVQETAALESALVVLGVSAQDAEAAVKGLSVAQRTELVDAAGGLDAFNQQFAFFASNFLTAEQQLEISFNALDERMRALGFSADITREEFTALIQSVTQVGGISVEVAADLLALAPAFDNVKNQEAALAAENERLASTASRASGSVSRLSGSVSGLDNAAAETAAAVEASFARIDQARADVVAAQNQLAVAEAQRNLSDAQQQVSLAANAVSQAQADLSRARSAAQQTAQQQQSDSIDAINEAIDQRSELIRLYEQEAGALRSTVDRFSALSDKIVDFRNSLSLGELSPFSPGEQLAIARQQFNQTRNLAAQGDEDALARLPEVSRDFLQASKTFNGATAAFESDFLFVQGVLDSAGATARQTRDIAADQLIAAESAAASLEAANEAAQQQIQALNNINTSFDDLNSNVLSVDQAMANLEAAEQQQQIAQQQVRDATRDVEAALFTQNGFIDDVGQATIQVRDAVNALAAAVLQGFGNAAISDQQIVDFVIANQNQSDAFFAQAAVDFGISGNQLKRALAPLGVSPERINVATGGNALRDSDIASVVNQKLAQGDFMGIYNLARANGVSSTRLASATALSKEEIDSFVRANNLQPFKVGTDFVPRDGIAMLHKGEAVVPSSTTQEIKLLRQEIIQLRREQNRQMEALINTNIAANQETAKQVAQSAKIAARQENWVNRSKPRVA